MTTGAKQNGAIAIDPAQSGTMHWRKWAGANSADRVQPQNYECAHVHVTHNSAASRGYPNPLNYTYSARGTPTKEMFWDNRAYLHGETSNKALGAMYDAIRGHDFSAVNNLAEIDETLHLLRQALVNAAGALRDLSRFDVPSFLRRIPKIVSGSRTKRGRLEDAANLGDISGVWLAAQYGWLPIIQGLQDAIDALKQDIDPLQDYRFTARATSPLLSLRVDPGGSVAIYSVYKQTVTYRCAVAEAPNQWRLAGFSWEYLPGVLWERIPFSFVFDYFLPIGQMLACWADTRVTQPYMRYVVRTAFQRHRHYKEGPYWTFDVGDSRNVKPGTCKFEAVVIKRTVNPLLLTVPPSLQGADRILRGNRVENTLALLHQLYLGNRKDVARWRAF